MSAVFVPVLHGVSVRTEELFTYRAFCGRCVDVTSHGVYRILEQEHVYFVSLGAPDCSEARCCSVCGLVAGCRSEAIDRDAPHPWAHLSSEERARRETDAFLRAHAQIATKVRWTPRVIALTAVIVAGLGAIGWLTSRFVGLAACGLVLGLAPVALFLHHEAARRVIEGAVARDLAPRVELLVERTGLRPSELARRARALRLLQLSRVLESPALASSAPGRGPYR